MIGTIIDHMKPKLRSKDYGGAIEQVVVEIDLILSGRQSEVMKMYPDSFEASDYILGFSLLVVFLLVGWNEFNNYRLITTKFLRTVSDNIAIKTFYSY